MSNRAELVATKFTTKNDESYGYRLFDDYATTYSNYSPATIMDMPDLELLEMVVPELSEEGSGIIKFIIEEKIGITINDNYYEWEDIEPVLCK